MKSRKFARREESPLLNRGLRWIGALAVLLIVLTLPDRLGDFRLPAAVRLPVELPLIILALVLFTGRLQAIVRAVIVAGLSLIVLLKVAHMAAYFGFDRPFNPVADILMLPTILDTTGRAGGLAAPIGIVVAALLLIGAIAGTLRWTTGVVVRGIPRHGQLPAAIAALAVTALIFTPFGMPTASVFVRDQTRAIIKDVREARAFRAELAQNPFHDAPSDSLLAHLKGTDVLLIFVESYGRASLDNPAYAPRLRGTLKSFDAALKDKGFSARSAWMASPTFGGESYLAHSAAVAGLWISNRQRYAQLLRSDHRTLISDFNTAGWRTVAVMPEITTAWPEGDFFSFGKIYRGPDLQYKGQSFDYLTMPDQYTLAAFQSRELASVDRAPVMAEIALVSSHIPWAPLPKLVPWDEVGDGRIFNTARTPESANDVWRDPKRVPEFYALSVDYTLQTLMSFVTAYAGDNTLLIIVGDHQPMTFIAGEGASHEVPVHIIARNPALLAALDEGTWTAGMEPDGTSPSWPMDSLRERILGAFTRRADQSESPPPEAEPETPPQQQ